MKIKYPDKEYNELESTYKVYLGGTIDNTNNWRENVINYLYSKNNPPIEIFNPIFEHKDNLTKEEIRKQINWEQKHLEEADLICLVLLDNSKSATSLLDLGLYSNSGKLLVFCTEDYSKYDKVYMTCIKYNIALFNTTNAKEIGNMILLKYIDYINDKMQ